MQQHSHNKQELLVYLVLWGILFLAPVIFFQIYEAKFQTESFPWAELFDVWKQIAVFLVAFLLHNFLLAPLLVYRQRRWLYFTSITLLVGCFFVVQCLDRPNRNFHEGPHPGPHSSHFAPRKPAPHTPHLAPRTSPPPPIFVGQHDIMATITLLLMLGMNIGVKLFFKQRRDQLVMQQLEKEHLEQQLQYLRYQINPHFLMNTLNNIHALVDIDPEQAKETIVELSKIMRFALYEGSRQRVPLGRDVAFLQSYIQLMRLRYTEKVRISVDLPQELPDCEIPPMMLITFVENAFKHGVSYRQESFIDIRLSVANRALHFWCSNSKAPKVEDSQGGVGLQNVKRRLDLLYGNNYKLKIEDKADVYNIDLEIPL